MCAKQAPPVPALPDEGNGGNSSFSLPFVNVGNLCRLCRSSAVPKSMERFKYGLNRREFLKLGGGFIATAAFTPLLRFAPISVSAKTEELTERNFHFTSLAQWQEYIEPEKEALRPLFRDQDLYRGALGTTIENQVEDLETYYDILRMGQKLFSVPVSMLWVPFIYESRCARDKNPDLGNPCKGAMQLSADNLKTPPFRSALTQIMIEVGFLAAVSGQRYIEGQPANGNGTTCETSDWWNIPLGAFHIRYSAKIYFSDQEPLDGFRNALKSRYSAYRGPQDVKHYEYLRGILEPVLSEVTLTLPTE